jgi:hypothetical protein
MLVAVLSCLCGLVLVVSGVAMWSVPAAFIVAGLGVVVVGAFGIDVDRKAQLKRDQPSKGAQGR